MNALKQWPRTTKLLAAVVIAGVLACLISLVPSPISIFRDFAGPIAPKIAEPEIVVAAPPPALETLAEITARPLFNFGRKADPAAPPPQAPKAAVTLGDLTQLKLVGLVTSGPVKLALVRRADASTLTLRAGDSLDGWTVDQISIQGVVFKGGEREETIKIPAAENHAVRHNDRAGGE